MTHLIDVQDLRVHFPIAKGFWGRHIGSVRAVDGVSFKIAPGETLGLVGESGCGKTTVGRALAQLHRPTSGKIFFQGKDLSDHTKGELKAIRRDIQVIFQDPFESLNSRHTIGEILEEPFVIHKIGKACDRRREVGKLLEMVGLHQSSAGRYPHEFSGGQRQRVGIARALALRPKFVICDEPVSALDVSIQSQILNLLLDLQEEYKLTYLFVAHDLAVVRHISDRVAVMYLGRILEVTDADRIYRSPKHPYTKALLASIPHPDPTRRRVGAPLKGEVPSPINPPSGCVFNPRCPNVMERCRVESPVLQQIRRDEGDNSSHLVACHLAE